VAASPHYQGIAGTAYHRSQHDIAPTIRGQLGARKLQKHLPPARRIVDFGCGNGAILAALNTGSERIGVDPIAENRQAVRDRGYEARESLSEIPDDWADAVISNHALEHTLDPLGALREIRRVLKPGGTLVLYVPADDWRLNRRYDAAERNHHLFSWTPLALGHLLAEAGFVVRRSEIERRAWPGRLTVPLAQRLSPVAFDGVMTVTAIVSRRREIGAVAT
jgi:SAM-dependent methyltransferase